MSTRSDDKLDSQEQTPAPGDGTWRQPRPDQDASAHLLGQRRRQFLMEMVDDIGRRISSILDLDTLLWEATKFARQTFNFYGVAVGLLDGGELSLRITLRGAGPYERQESFRLPLNGRTLATRVATVGQAEVVPDTTAQPDYLPLDFLPNTRSEIVVPITHGEQIVGVLVAASDRADDFASEDLKLLETLARHIAVAVTNARLVAAQNAETWGSAILLRVARLLSRIPSQQEIAYAVMGLALDLTGAEHGALLVWDTSGMDMGQRHIFPSNDRVSAALEELGPGWENMFMRRVADLDQLQVSYLQAADPVIKPLMTDIGIEVMLLAPIQCSDQMWGTLALGYPSVHRFTRYDFSLIAGLAAQTAAAIENAQLIKKVQDERSYLEAVLSSTGEGLFLIGVDGRVRYCNSRLKDLTGVDFADVRDKPYDVLFHHFAELSNDVRQVEYDLELAVNNLDQSPIVNVLTRYTLIGRLQVSLFPIRDESDYVIGWGGIVRDVTAEWDEVSQRTEHLSLLSHELRTPLATIKGFVSTLLSNHRYWGEKEREEFLESINESVDQLSRLLENAREMSRLELGGVKLYRRPTDVKRLVQRVIQSLTFQTSGRYFKVDVPDDLPTVEVDPFRIEQVLYNLLDNAIKYSSADKPVRIAAQKKGDEVIVSVADQGVGIPKEHLERIFEHFYQVDYGGADRGRGAGLGLYISRGLIHAHGGRMWAESTLGQGTTVYFALPVEARLMEQPLEKLPAVSQARAGRARGDGHKQTEKVLLVEDDPQMLRLLKITMEADGYRVISAARGKAAIDLAASELPDVILLDVHLPDASGFDVCDQMRQFTNVPVLMITGNATEDDIVRGLDMGADDYLVKPFSNKELLARVRASLRRARLPESTQTEPLFRAGDLEIDFAQRQVTMRGKPVKLTPTEYKLLYHLAVNAGRVLTHSQLLAKVWGTDWDQETQYLWVNISRLRKKLEVDPAKPEYIMTEAGVGYYLGHTH